MSESFDQRSYEAAVIVLGLLVFFAFTLLQFVRFLLGEQRGRRSIWDTPIRIFDSPAQKRWGLSAGAGYLLAYLLPTIWQFANYRVVTLVDSKGLVVQASLVVRSGGREFAPKVDPLGRRLLPRWTLDEVRVVDSRYKPDRWLAREMDDVLILRPLRKDGERRKPLNTRFFVDLLRELELRDRARR